MKNRPSIWISNTEYTSDIHWTHDSSLDVIDVIEQCTVMKIKYNIKRQTLIMYNFSFHSFILFSYQWHKSIIIILTIWHNKIDRKIHCGHDLNLNIIEKKILWKNPCCKHCSLNDVFKPNHNGHDNIPRLNTDTWCQTITQLWHQQN